jgi:chondroitin sulfate synthase
VDGEEVSVKSREEDENYSVLEDPLESRQVQSYFRETFESGLLKIGETFPGMLSPYETKTSLSKIRDKVINFILPLAGRFDAFQRFVSVYEDVCLQDDQKTTLTVVLYSSLAEPMSFSNSMNVVQQLQLKYPLATINIVPASGSFARAEALELGTSKYDDNVENLLFFVDVDMVFNSKTLDRIRTNTIKGKQAYFPIVFSEYDPHFSHEGASTLRNHFIVDCDSGYWRQFGYGIVSVYKSDLKSVGGFDTGIRGWGKEDVDLFDKFVSTAANFSVFRAVDPQLVHVFHIVDCDTKLDDVQHLMCMGSRADTYGSVPQLAKYIYNHKDQILKFAKYRKHQEPPS